MKTFKDYLTEGKKNKFNDPVNNKNADERYGSIDKNNEKLKIPKDVLLKIIDIVFDSVDDLQIGGPSYSVIDERVMDAVERQLEVEII